MAHYIKFSPKGALCLHRRSGVLAYLCDNADRVFSLSGIIAKIEERCKSQKWRSAVHKNRHRWRLELSPEKANFGTKSATPVFVSPPIQPSGSGLFYFHVKPLVTKGFAKHEPPLKILCGESLGARSGVDS